MKGIERKKSLSRVRNGTGDLFLCPIDALKYPGDAAE
jgi:hypothetical protein